MNTASPNTPAGHMPQVDQLAPGSRRDGTRLQWLAELMSCAEVAERLQVTPWHVVRMIEAGALPTVTLIHQADVDALLDRAAEPAPGGAQ